LVEIISTELPWTLTLSPEVIFTLLEEVRLVSSSIDSPPFSPWIIIFWGTIISRLSPTFTFSLSTNRLLFPNIIVELPVVIVTLSELAVIFTLSFSAFYNSLA